ncbi:hypothetical protein [Bradyrhizobium cenepequi]|uniref:hypothetical protein n=1 Tax=Bradyrhizobium cenepequi TaxID=2821403 RepID=UPI001CE268B0|nr:hypothetical protein [Bradyrhizobium cenepequi]MCA6112574.1 hypothetical protein [Bradyrhizobium cenepequi]
MLGAGLAVLPRQIIPDDISADRLRRVLHGWHAAPVPIYAMTETPPSKSPAVSNSCASA